MTYGTNSVQRKTACTKSSPECGVSHELVPKKNKSLTKKVSLYDNLIIHGDNLKALKVIRIGRRQGGGDRRYKIEDIEKIIGNRKKRK